jgi:UDP-N-acetylmuramyl pentapeptide phosphotransferase/UDP-N-acetylglucosamine-1-phosphate transferase
VYAFFAVLAAFLASAAGTRVLIGWLSDRQLVAHENDRTMHAGKVPQGGGIAVVASTLAIALLAGPWSPWLSAILPAALALAAMSAFNDRHEIPAKWRLAAHLLAATLAVSLVPGNVLIFGGLLPWVLDRLIVLIALAWFINLYNFMDGIDGIAGVESIALAAGYVAVVWAGSAPTAPAGLTGLALAIAGASAGFLIFNWHRALIFLGDVGSIPLGFLTGALLVHLAATQSLAAAAILPLYYVTDATLTLTRRYIRGEVLSRPHREHAYQRAARASGSHSAVVVRIAACNMVLVAAALLALRAPWLGLLAAILAVAALLWQLEDMAENGAAGDPKPALNPLRF